MRGVPVGVLSITGVRVVRGQHANPMACAPYDLGQDGPTRLLVERYEAFDRGARLRCRRHPIVVARDEELPAVQRRSQRHRLGDRSQSDITQMQDYVVNADDVVPSPDELSVHLRSRCERAIRELADPRMAEVRVGRDVVDLIEVKRRILVRHRFTTSVIRDPAGPSDPARTGALLNCPTDRWTHPDRSRTSRHRQRGQRRRVGQPCRPRRRS